VPLRSGSRVRELRISLAVLHTTFAISGCNVRLRLRARTSHWIGPSARTYRRPSAVKPLSPSRLRRRFIGRLRRASNLLAQPTVGNMMDRILMDRIFVCSNAIHGSEEGEVSALTGADHVGCADKACVVRANNVAKL
jgi:hypothetical protein